MNSFSASNDRIDVLVRIFNIFREIIFSDQYAINIKTPSMLSWCAGSDMGDQWWEPLMLAYARYDSHAHFIYISRERESFGRTDLIVSVCRNVPNDGQLTLMDLLLLLCTGYLSAPLVLSQIVCELNSVFFFNFAALR